MLKLQKGKERILTEAEEESVPHEALLRALLIPCPLFLCAFGRSPRAGMWSPKKVEPAITDTLQKLNTSN